MSRFISDESNCGVTVIRHGVEATCGAQAIENECKFHGVLRRQADARRRCRLKSVGLVKAECLDRYDGLMANLVLALRRNRVQVGQIKRPVGGTR